MSRPDCESMNFTFIGYPDFKSIFKLDKITFFTLFHNHWSLYGWERSSEEWKWNKYEITRRQGFFLVLTGLKNWLHHQVKRYKLKPILTSMKKLLKGGYN